MVLGVWLYEVYFSQETLVLQLQTQTVPDNHSTHLQGKGFFPLLFSSETHL